MKKSIALPVCLLGAAGLYWVVQAGNLDPPGPPSPTMKNLDLIPPTWSERLDSTNGSTLPLFEGCGSDRFECLLPLGSPLPLPRAVLDRETGLVWERSPASDVQTWTQANLHCLTRTTGGRRGWRLPAVEELSSLFDPDEFGPALPPGHPFLNITAENYWSSTTSPSATYNALAVVALSGDLIIGGKSALAGMWCVRGGAPKSFTSQPNS